MSTASSRARRVGQSLRRAGRDAAHRRQLRLGLSGLLLGLGFAAGVVPARAAVPCETLEHRGGRHIVCTVDFARHDLRLFLGDADGRPLGSFSALRKMLGAEGLALAFGMNGGMYPP